jgi:hypothetical protein
MRWFFAVTLGGGFLVAILTASAGFALTKDYHFLFFISPALFTPLMRNLIPMDEKRYRLQASAIRAMAPSKRSIQRMNNEKNKHQA